MDVFYTDIIYIVMKLITIHMSYKESIREILFDAIPMMRLSNHAIIMSGSVPPSNCRIILLKHIRPAGLWINYDYVLHYYTNCINNPFLFYFQDFVFWILSTKARKLLIFQHFILTFGMKAIEFKIVASLHLIHELFLEYLS